MRIRTVDAFTDRPYAGNPAAVVLLEPGPFPAEERMQRLASELNLAETAYARPLSGDPEADWALRWFTPSTEVGLCGHATLATAHVLREDGLLPGSGDGGARVRFRTRSGVLTATAAEDGAIALDFPTAPLTPRTAPVEGLAAALGAEPVASYDTGPLGYLLVELADEAAVRAPTPEAAAVAALPGHALVVTASADAAAGCGYAYVSRMFAPSLGIPEDPVTGSAHTALAPLWSGRLGRPTLTGMQVSPRTGLVRTTLRGDRTELAGGAVTVLDAELRTEF